MRFAAGQSVGRLPERKVAEPHLVEDSKRPMDRLYRTEALLSFGERHLQNLVNVLAAVRDREGFLGVSPSVTDLAVDVDVR